MAHKKSNCLLTKYIVINNCENFDKEEITEFFRKIR